MAKAVEPDRRTVTIECTVHDEGSLFLRREIGKATDPDTNEDYVMATNADTTPLVMLPDGRWVSFNWHALVNAAAQVPEGD